MESVLDSSVSLVLSIWFVCSRHRTRRVWSFFLFLFCPKVRLLKMKVYLSSDLMLLYEHFSTL